jgi:AcrR family transcriptional regulator
LENRPISERRTAARENPRNHYAERRRQVIRAAAEVFRVKGFGATSIRDVAEAANVNRASVYYYVESKEELFEAVVLDALEANVEMAEKVCRSSRDPVEKLDQLVKRLLRSYAENYPQMYVFIQESTGGNASAGIHDLERRFGDAFTKVIEQGIKRGVFRSDLSPRVASNALLGMVNWTHRWYRPDGALTADELGDQFVRLMCRGHIARGDAAEVSRD